MAIFKQIDPRISHYDHFIVHCTATKVSQKNIDAKWVDKAHKKTRLERLWIPRCDHS